MTEKKRPQWRFRWRDLAMGPAGADTITNATDCRALYWIADRIHKGQVDCFPKVQDLLSDSGCSASPFHAATQKLVLAGWLGRISGHVGRNSTYWLLLPDAVFQTLEDEDAGLYLAYVAAIDKKHGTMGGKVAADHSPEIRSDSSQDQDRLHPISGAKTPDFGTPTYVLTSEEPPLELKAADAGRGIDGKAEGKVAVPALPPVPFEIVSLWNDHWPKLETLIVPWGDDMDLKMARLKLRDAAFVLLGWAVRRADYDRAPWAKINDELKDMPELDGLAESYRTGKLTNVALAHVLARAGLVPPARGEDGGKIAQVA